MEKQNSIGIGHKALKQLGGYVTTYKSVAHRGESVLEQTLGFNFGALRKGYSVYELKSRIELPDFSWKDRTVYSDGWHWDSSIDEFVRREDEFRADLLVSTASDAISDGRIRIFMEAQRELLNVRLGENRIVKLVPKSHVFDYPDAKVDNVPQWKLLKRKLFRLLAEIGPGSHLR
ncbi:MAG: hypothetical protein ABJB66_18800 [Gemmatimonadaceae bacterium]